MTDKVKQNSPNSKVYIEIVKQLREMISADGLKTGDKIPSERELSERLNVGRSSVREALRALELLGLIETRRGEGTFIRDFKGHQLVQLLSTFILQDEKARVDVQETKYYIEMDCLRILLKREDLSLQELKSSLADKTADDDDFFYRLIHMADNHLFFRMWLILKDYYHSLNTDKQQASQDDYLNLIEAIESREIERVLLSYRRLRKIVEL